MNSRSDFDDQLREWADLGDERLPARYLDGALAQVDTTSQRGAGWWPLKELIMKPKPLAALAFLGAVALVVGLAVGRLSPQVTDRPSASPFASQPATPPPDLGKAGIWSPERAQLDWPVPVREEPSGQPLLTTLEPETGFGSDEMPWFSDPSGDQGPSAPGWLDIIKVRVQFSYGYDPVSGEQIVTGDPRGVDIELASPAPADFPHPRQRWVAYGLVVDVDDDGQPDVRFGMDNDPDGDHRAWWTDLATGVTSSRGTGPLKWYVKGRIIDTWLPGESQGFGRMFFNSDKVGAFKFYAWASLIEDGQVVATDYAPDAGWVDGSPFD